MVVHACAVESFLSGFHRNVLSTSMKHRHLRGSSPHDCALRVGSRAWADVALRATDAALMIRRRRRHHYYQRLLTTVLLLHSCCCWPERYGAAARLSWLSQRQRSAHNAPEWPSRCVSSAGTQMRCAAIGPELSPSLTLTARVPCPRPILPCADRIHLTRLRAPLADGHGRISLTPNAAGGPRNSFWVLPSDSIGRWRRAWRPTLLPSAAEEHARDGRLSRVSIALFRCVGLAADEALPVLLDGDH